MNYTLLQIKNILNSDLKGNEESEINYVVFDSRKTIPSVKTIFFAIKSSQNDGHKYIEEIYTRGIKNFVVNREFVEFHKFPDANFIIVNCSVVALQQFAKYHRNQFKIPVIAVTGSNGKTIVKEWFTVLASDYKKTLQSPKSYNSQIGVPISVLELKKTHELAIFEAGISQKNEMQNLEQIIDPEIAVFTNIGDAHQENFSSINAKITEKLILFKNAKTIIYSSDNELIDDAICQKYPNKKKFIFGKNFDSDLIVKKITKKTSSSILNLSYKNKNYKLEISFTDSASIENLLTVLFILLVIFYRKTPESFDFSKLQSIEMRLQQIQGKNNCTIINDSYNCDLVSLRIALDVLKAQKQHLKKTLILSDIFEVGLEEKQLYKTISNLLKNSNINRIIGVGESIRRNSNFFKISKQFYSKTEEFIEELPKYKFKNEAILLKGARKFHFEKISNELQLKNHRTVLEINLNAFEHNLQYFRSLLLPETKMMIMVKAFSYGSGSFEIANFLHLRNVDYLSVAIADEGIELRKAGITTPILVLNPDIDNLDIFVDYALEPEIYSFKMFEAFEKSIKNKVYNRYPVHLKINTGMNRLGFSIEDIEKLISKLNETEYVFVKSVFSHLVGSGDKKFDDFTNLQIEKYKNFVSKLEQYLDYKFLKHILNSSGIERFPEAQFDMVRLGIGLYGISAKNNKLLKNISRLKTQIIQKINVKAGETIGYNRVGEFTKEGVVATLPIGYADGLNRKLSNGIGKVKINGKFAPIIGNICMDLTMIDITDIAVNEGDEVIIFDDDYSVSEIAEQLETIPYEILTSISSRVKRIYVWD